MAIAELITADQYLHTSFEHDAEFVEGGIVERPLPTWEHSFIQGYLLRVLYDRISPLGWFVVPEQRVQCRLDRFRVPDVCVVQRRPSGPVGRRIVSTPPWLCVEILSPEDSSAATGTKVRDYLDFGVPWVWVIDPVTCNGQIHTRGEIVSVQDKVFSTDLFRIDLAQADI